MPRRKEHGGHSQNPFHPFLTKTIERVPQDRLGEFQVTVFHRQAPHSRPQPFSESREFFNSKAVATAMTANQDAHLSGIEFREVRGHGLITCQATLSPALTP